MAFDNSPNFARHFQWETHAILQRTAPFIRALVEIRGEKVLEQETMRAMQFHAIEPRLNRAASGFAKIADHSQNFIMA